MAEKGPAVEFRETIHGHGDIVFPDHRVSDVNFSLERSRYAYTEGWRLTAHARQWAEGLRHFQPASIEGHTDYGTPVRVPYFRPGTQTIPSGRKSRVRFHGWAEEVRIGDDSVEVTPKSHVFTVYLTETPIALPMYHHLPDQRSGQVIGEDPREPFVWDCHLGRAHIERWFVREKATVGDSDASVRIPRSAIFVGGPPANSEPKPLRVVLETLTDELRDLCSVLSFLGRQRVDWVQIEVRPDRAGGRRSAGHYEIKWFKEAIAAPPPPGVEPLIRPDAADRALIANMVNAYRPSAIQRSLFYAIASLGEVFQPSFVEQRVAAAFSALEAVVNGLAEAEGNEFTLGDTSFSALCREIRRTIKESGKRIQPPLTSEQRADIYAKLHELNRPPVADRVMRFVNKYQVDWRDLWPNADSLASVFRPAYNRRSRLVHVGRLEDVEASIRDYVNVHALTERLVYAVLDGDKSALNPLAYRHVDM